MRFLRSALDVLPAILLFCMVILTSASVLSRYAFNMPLPDEYELTKMLLSVVICWGVAGAFRKDEHIYLDVFWGRFSPESKRILNRIGAFLSLLILAGYCWALFVKVLDTMRSSITTLELGIPVWGFQFAAWLGTLAAVIVLLNHVIHPTSAEPAQAIYR